MLKSFKAMREFLYRSTRALRVASPRNVTGNTESAPGAMPGGGEQTSLPNAETESTFPAFGSQGEGRKMERYSAGGSVGTGGASSSAEAREVPPVIVPNDPRAEFDRFVEAGSVEQEGGDGMLMPVVIGFDFGTSATKLVARFPDEPGSPAFVVPAPAHCLGEENPHLWKTVLWLTTSGAFVTCPESGAQELASLKADITGSVGGSDVRRRTGGVAGTSVVEAVGAYIAFVIRYARGYLRIEHRSRFRGRRPVWMVNLGLPAANYDNERLFQAYRKAAAGGLLLANSGKPIGVETARDILKSGEVERAATSREHAEEIGVAVFPETAAAATAFAKSPGHAHGVYVMIDVGAMTLDVCTFILTEDGNGGDKFSLLEADVQALGVESFRWRQERGENNECLLKRAERCLHGVIWNTKKHYWLEACWKAGNSLPMFLIGGGANNEPHRRVVGSLGPWLEKHAENSGIRLIDLPSSRLVGSRESLIDSSRHAVACGLSYPPDQIGEIVPPSEIDHVPPLRSAAADMEKRFVSKDQV